MEKVVDRHVWYDGDVSIRDYRGGAEDAIECSFSDLSEQSKTVVKDLISHDAKQLKNTNHIVAFSDLTLDDGREIANATINFMCYQVRVADKLDNSPIWQNGRYEDFTNFPDTIIETVVSDILDAKDGKTKFDQLSFGDYLDKEELNDLFDREAQAFGAEVERQEKFESLPVDRHLWDRVDRHLWYSGEVHIENRSGDRLKFSELPQLAQEKLKYDIVHDSSNDPSIIRHIFKDKRDPDSLLWCGFKACVSTADKLFQGNGLMKKCLIFKHCHKRLKRQL